MVAVPHYTLEDLNEAAIDWRRPFVVSTGFAVCEESAFAQLRKFETGTFIALGSHHNVMVHDAVTDEYLKHDRQLSLEEFADLVRSGEAKRHDLYWAYFNAFAQLEVRLGLAADDIADRRTHSFGGGLSKEHGISIKGKHTGDPAHSVPLKHLIVWAGPAGHVEYLHYDDEVPSPIILR